MVGDTEKLGLIVPRKLDSNRKPKVSSYWEPLL
jgi:hypothetical protein